MEETEQSHTKEITSKQKTTKRERERERESKKGRRSRSGKPWEKHPPKQHCRSCASVKIIPTLGVAWRTCKKRKGTSQERWGSPRETEEERGNQERERETERDAKHKNTDM